MFSFQSIARICALALERKIDMAELFEYSLTPLPLCFSTFDGQLTKNRKSALSDAITKKYDCFVVSPQNVNVDIIDKKIRISKIGHHG